jgi:hypothetical protein
MAIMENSVYIAAGNVGATNASTFHVNSLLGSFLIAIAVIIIVFICGKGLYP